jgi:phosphomannomutase
MKKILLFDVDGTICDSGKQIKEEMAESINRLANQGYEIGIVGGGKFDKILYQLDDKVHPEHIFSECGSVYHLLYEYEYELVYKNNLREEPEYEKINKLVKISLKFISETDYLVSGNFIDLRNGLIYISLVGMVATDEERANFIEKDKINGYRTTLLNILREEAISLGISETIDITYGGTVGLAIYPKKWNKVQVLETIRTDFYEKIYYFGDKYEKDGNDYELIINPDVIGVCVDSLNDTKHFLDGL